ncbi:MAG: glycoside hydrolase TIM-barrel-like domain-containing protein, partial [Alphaproteobacteria bacterium]|nr:glycoside hydrolase TIM-barrel-like domain-containing protein [Alphaproteobacteria bacterium]
GLLSVFPEYQWPVIRGNALRWENGVKATVLSASDPDSFRGPQFAAAWCDELGCGAVDKGANQPNIFGDEKSAESGRPYFSSGLPDALIQRQVLRAHQVHWRQPGNNPPGMVDIDRIYHWSWDARPYPAFPALTDVWSDGVNHRTGHWLTGRLGGLASDELAVAIAADHGVSLVAEPAAPFIGGYLLTGASTGRAALEPIAAIAGQSIANRAAGLHLRSASAGTATTVLPDDLAQEDGPTLTRRRGDPAEAPGRLSLNYIDRERDYLSGAVTALALDEGPLEAANLALVLDGSAARLAAERLLDAKSGRIETLDFALPPGALALEPGDLLHIAGQADGPFEIVEVVDAAVRTITARTLPTGMAMATSADRPVLAGAGPNLPVVSLIEMAHLPALPDDTSHTRLVVAGYAQPWPGALQLVDATTGANLVTLDRRGVLGETATALAAGPLAVWGRGAGLEVTLYAGHLAAAEPLAVLAGSNRLAIQTDAGGWEVIGFAGAELIGPARYHLTGLLRGLQGTGPAMGPISPGRRVMALDARVAVVPVAPDWLGDTRALRAYAGSADLTGTALSVIAEPSAALPLSPVHLQARRLDNGDIAVSWVRCSRADGDGWGLAEVPLEHAPERYRLVISAGGLALRTIEISGPAAIYPMADQLTDFGGAAAGFVFTIAQISPVLGTGHAAEGSFDG